MVLEYLHKYDVNMFKYKYRACDCKLFKLTRILQQTQTHVELQILDFSKINKAEKAQLEMH